MLSAIESCRNDLQTSMSISQQSTACEIERLKVELERIRSDLKHEDEKIGSSQKLDLNLEKGPHGGGSDPKLAPPCAPPKLCKCVF